MSESFCGKNCDDCKSKASLGCSGCKNGVKSTDCQILECCTDRMLKKCHDCDDRYDCSIHKLRDWMPDERKKKTQLKDDGFLVGRWLIVMFWLIIGQLVASNVLTERFFSSDNDITSYGNIIAAVCTAGYGLALLRLSAVDEQYRLAGIFSLLGAAINAFSSFSEGSPEKTPLPFLLSILVIVLMLLSKGFEYHAHVAILYGVDDDLAGKWETLWVEQLVAYFALIVTPFLSAIIPFLSVILIIAAFGAIVLDIIHLVYLRRTAFVFTN